LFVFIILSAALAIGIPPLVRWLFAEGFLPSVPSFLYPTTWLVALITAVVFVYLYRLNRPRVFTQFYLLSLVIKMVAALAYCLIIVLKHPSGAVVNVVFFLVLYFLFTTLEIALLYRKISAAGRP